MRLSVRNLTIEHLWLGLPVFVLLWKGFLFTLPPLDFWWHLKMGEIIVTTGAIPSTDLFSFTAAGQPFVVQNWLAEIIYYATHRAGGFPLLVFLHTLLSLAAFIPVYLLCLRASSNLRIAVVIAFIAALCNIGNIRPHLFSFALFAVFYWIVERYRSRDRDRLWLLPPLMALWVNLHGAFVLGLVLVVIVMVTEAVRRWLDPQRGDALSWQENRKLALVFIACVFATMVNPEGYRVYEYVKVVASDAGSQLFVTEWQPPRVDELVGILVFYGPFFLTLLALVASRQRPDLTELALFIAFAVLALKSLRNGAWFSTIAFPICARHLSRFEWSWIESLRRFRWAANLREAFFPEPSASSGNFRLNAAFALIAVAVVVVQSPWVRPKLYAASLLDPVTPVAAMDYIEQSGISGNIFHPQVFGDYLIWRLWPRQHTFIDGRVHLFGEKFVRDYQALFTDSEWQAKIDGWDIRYLLLHKNPGDAGSETLLQRVAASHRWKPLYEDGLTILYEKK
jgi:hypothetical protein